MPNGEYGDIYRFEHEHEAVYASPDVLQFILDLKRECLLDEINTSGVIITNVMANSNIMLKNYSKINNMPSFTALQQIVNRFRKKHAPPVVTDLFFDIDSPLYSKHIPKDFLCADLKKQDARHLIFATEQQLAYL